ncbi:uncharacterized protein LOC122067574 [Macadamia integrifolia]|uniref:uncharacterized protein LOC122067574 n=1 Tax=Macadamia integrifolia TaxID=60698 RepID=UPI001C4FE500|nr:uncharacterized protein LOC122067574 [Macadamia integrifolia]
MVEGQNQIGEYIVDFFERFHKEAPTETHVELLDNILKVINQMDCYRLDSLPGNEEIRTAVWELDPDSSPGLDGFSGAFFHKCWSLVEVEVCNAVRQFFSTGYMPYGVNNNFLVLIPKVEGANTLDRFRPLCMGNFFCKIISKVMAMRLEPLLPRLISKEQGAFQKGKLIHDNISMASELANLIWINWLHQLLISSKISILVNGGPQGYFKVERGLRQGDPISPILFIIAEEVLSRGLSSLVQCKELQAIHGPRGAATPGHILFVDDIFIFTNASLSLKKCVSSSIVSGVKKVWSFVEENQRWIIGNGNLVNFSKDKWWGPKSVLEELQIMDLTAL